MMLIEVEAKRLHIGQMARKLRSEHAAILRHAPASIHRQLLDAFNASIVRRAWFVDGRLAAIAGLVGTMTDDAGTIWLALSDEVAKTHPIVVARAAERFVERMMRTRSVLSTDILVGDKPSRQFATFLGFLTTGHSVIDGIETIQMSCKRRKAA